MEHRAQRIVAIDHPSLVSDVAGFLSDLRREPRHFGRTARPASKPLPSVVSRLEGCVGIRMGAYEDGSLIALGTVADDGEVTVAVTRERRTEGVGRELLTALVARARDRGHRRLVLPAGRRSPVLLDVAGGLGATAVDLGRGRVELVFDLRHGVRAVRSSSASDTDHVA